VSVGSPLPHGFRRLHLDEVTSTSDVARDLAEQGEEAGLFVTADLQTAGRGRMGRLWQSPPGNLYASLILRPQVPLAQASSLSLVVALALAEAVADLSGGLVEPRVKWPNDVLVGGAKAAGILLEGTADGRGGCVWLVAGIGVNVRWSPPAGELPYPTTHLAAQNGLAALTATALLEELAGPLRRRLMAWEAGGFALLRDAWLARAHRLGEIIELKVGEGIVRGRFVDIDTTGALRLEPRPGAIERFTAGEIAFG
jgi:BirA family biotin operon repressor/biotin-[acetyl-CoA-carboxylase] ligase